MTGRGNGCTGSELELRNSGFDGIECRLLTIVRHFLLSYTKPQSLAWEAALDLSCMHFGQRDGPVVGMCIVNLLRAIRQSRKTTFHFKNPHCRNCSLRVSDCERHLIGAVKATRNRKVAEARTEVLILCEGFETAKVTAAINSLASVLPAPSAPAQSVPAIRRTV